MQFLYVKIEVARQGYKRNIGVILVAKNTLFLQTKVFPEKTINSYFIIIILKITN